MDLKAVILTCLVPGMAPMACVVIIVMEIGAIVVVFWIRLVLEINKRDNLIFRVSKIYILT